MPTSLRSRGTERRTRRLTIRIPESLHSALIQAAEHETRSVSDYIVVQLTKATAATLAK